MYIREDGGFETLRASQIAFVRICRRIGNLYLRLMIEREEVDSGRSNLERSLG